MLLAMQNGSCKMMQGGGDMMSGGRYMMERGMTMNQGGSIMHIIHGCFAILFGFAFLAIVIIAAVWLYRLMKKCTCEKKSIQPIPTFETALEILRRRYAEGAISTEEYLERKEHLV